MNMNKKSVEELVGAYCIPYMSEGYMLTGDERAALIKVLREKPDVRNLAIALILFTGLRASEAVALRREDVNFEEGTLSVTRAEIKCRITDNGKYTITTAECPSKFSRTIIMSDEATQILEAAIRANPRSEFLFAERDGKLRVTWDMLARRLRIDCDAAEIARKHPVALRLSYAISQMQAGIDIQTILMQMGLPGTTGEWN